MYLTPPYSQLAAWIIEFINLSLDRKELCQKKEISYIIPIVKIIVIAWKSQINKVKFFIVSAYDVNYT